MAHNVDRILEQRRHQVGGGQRAQSVVFSFVVHVALAAGFLWLPTLFPKPQQEFEFVEVMVMTPQALGIDVPPPPAPEPEPPPPEPPPPEAPPPAQVDPEVPVLRTDKEPKPSEKPAPTPLPRPSLDPPKRQGSALGTSLGASTNTAAIGVEDPNFTYGYYLDRVVSLISANWRRPPVGTDATQCLFHFRIRKDGTIVGLELRQSSGSATFDSAATRAVEAASPLPPLPRSYKQESLGINLIVK